jgi:hypothetical protein
MNTIKINGLKVRFVERMRDYVCGTKFSDYEEEYLYKAIPSVLVREVYPIDKYNFFIGQIHEWKEDKFGSQFPVTIEVDSVEYTLVDFEEDDISYLRTDALNDSVYVLIRRTHEEVEPNVFKYIYGVDEEVFETRKEAEKAADYKIVDSWNPEQDSVASLHFAVERILLHTINGEYLRFSDCFDNREFGIAKRQMDRVKWCLEHLEPNEDGILKIIACDAMGNLLVESQMNENLPTFPDVIRIKINDLNDLEKTIREREVK